MTPTADVRLTSLSSCAGCAAKLPQAALAELMAELPPTPGHPNVLVSSSTADDAAIYRVSRELALVQTVDFFTPIVDDPFSFGAIAATNAISDVYAMGGRPITALNLLGVPADVLSRNAIAEILRGGLTKATESRCAVVGGHTIRLPEPVYGMAVTGVVAPRNIIANTNAVPGDWLVLTKPLGTGIVTTAIKRGIASNSVREKAIAVMSTLNRVGAEIAERRLARAGTDVTGFGLLGHLANICRGSDAGAEITAESVPAISDEVIRLIEEDCIPGGSQQNLKTADAITDWNGATNAQRHLLTDAQTSGGLLLCIPSRHLEPALRLLRKFKTPCAAVIGRIVHTATPSIRILSGGSIAPLAKVRLNRPSRNLPRRTALQ